MANELELRVEQQVGLLNWNFDEINRQVDAQILKYDGLVITADQIKEAKDLRADLNNLKGKIEDKRKEAKKEFCSPYERFAEQVKVVTSKIEKVTSNLDVQIKDFENREKEEKRIRIEQWWNENCVTVPAIPFEIVFDKRFLNKTCKDADWQKTLTDKCTQAKKDLESISNIETKQKRDYVLAEFLKALSLGDALGKWEVYSEQLKIAEEFSKRAEEKRQALEQRNSVEKQQKAEQTEETSTNTIPENNDTQNTPNMSEEQMYTRVIQVVGTKEQLIALADFMNGIGIKFKKA